MRKLIMPLAAVFVLGYGVRFAAAEKFSGVLIDDKCAAKFHDEAGAAKHPAGCALKCSAEHPLVLFSGDKQIALDDKGQDLGKAYLAKDGAKTKVTITGEKDGDKIKVESIEASE